MVNYLSATQESTGLNNNCICNTFLSLNTFHSLKIKDNSCLCVLKCLVIINVFVNVNISKLSASVLCMPTEHVFYEM